MTTWPPACVQKTTPINQPEARWINRGPSNEVLSDIWIHTSLAQFHGRKGFLGHIIRREVNEHKELNVERMLEALQNYLATAKLRAGHQVVSA